jgi:predicted AAA+ superfamily ATPase
LFVIKEIPAWCPNLRSKTSIRSLPKKEFFDPSLACAALGINSEGLSKDKRTRGFFFECLVGRDLEVYSKTIDGEISYYRDRLGLECDFVIHLPDGRYGLFEVKSSDEQISEGIKNLEKMMALIRAYNDANPTNTMELPTVRAIITDGQYGYLSKEGIYIIPISCLKN